MIKTNNQTYTLTPKIFTTSGRGFKVDSHRRGEYDRLDRADRFDRVDRGEFDRLYRFDSFEMPDNKLDRGRLDRGASYRGDELDGLDSEFDRRGDEFGNYRRGELGELDNYHKDRIGSPRLGGNFDRLARDEFDNYNGNYRRGDDELNRHRAEVDDFDPRHRRDINRSLDRERQRVKVGVERELYMGGLRNYQPAGANEIYAGVCVHDYDV